MFFRKRKIYKVEYTDTWQDYGCVVVKATDEAAAWKKTKRQHPWDSPYRAIACLCITELKDA